jgi:hypothetical protein
LKIPCSTLNWPEKIIEKSSVCFPPFQNYALPLSCFVSSKEASVNLLRGHRDSHPDELVMVSLGCPGWLVMTTRFHEN